MKIEFNADGTVDIYQNTTRILDDIPLGTLAPNGAIYSAGNIEIIGTGKVDTPNGGTTIGSGGNILLSNEIQYKDNPETNPNSNDLLALVAWNDLIIDNYTKIDWNLQAVLMSVTGSLSATYMNKIGHMNYYGSAYQSVRGNAKMFQSFQKRYIHDERLDTMTPPFYPGMSSLHLVAWWE